MDCVLLLRQWAHISEITQNGQVASYFYAFDDRQVAIFFSNELASIGIVEQTGDKKSIDQHLRTSDKCGVILTKADVDNIEEMVRSRTAPGHSSTSQSLAGRVGQVSQPQCGPKPLPALPSIPLTQRCVGPTIPPMLVPVDDNPHTQSSNSFPPVFTHSSQVMRRQISSLSTETPSWYKNPAFKRKNDWQKEVVEICIGRDIRLGPDLATRQLLFPSCASSSLGMEDALDFNAATNTLCVRVPAEISSGYEKSDRNLILFIPNNDGSDISRQQLMVCYEYLFSHSDLLIVLPDDYVEYPLLGEAFGWTFSDSEAIIQKAAQNVMSNSKRYFKDKIRMLSRTEGARSYVISNARSKLESERGKSWDCPFFHEARKAFFQQFSGPDGRTFSLTASRVNSGRDFPKEIEGASLPRSPLLLQTIGERVRTLRPFQEYLLEWLGGPSLLKEALLFRGPNGERFTIEKSNPLGGTVTIHIHCEGSVVSNGETVRFPIEIQLPYYTYKRETPHEEYKLSMLDFLMEQAEIGLLSHTGDVNKVITEIFNLILPPGNSEGKIFDIVAFNSSVTTTKTTLTFGNPILGTADSVYVLDVEKKGSNEVILTLQKESGGSAGTSDFRQIEMVFQIHDSGKKSISIDVDKTSEASSRLIDGKTTIVSKQECRIIERGSGQFDIEVRKGSTLSVYRLEKNECIFVPEGCTTIKSTEKSGEMRDALYSLHALLSNMTMINHPYTMFGDKHAMDSLFISGFVDFASSDLPLVVTSKGPMDDQTRIELSIVTRMRQARCYTSSSGYQRDLAYLKAAKQARDENRR